MQYVSDILKGFSEIFFQNNIIFGLTILVALFIVSPIAGIYAIIGNIVGYSTGHFLSVEKDILQTGVYGFNGVLIGAGVSYYVKSIPAGILLVVVGSILGAVIFYFLAKHHITAYALPFVIVIMGIVFVTKYFRL